ncbi:MAG: L-fucose isomerase, partial [Clostridia bacterium]|nr:L-fucose isomerase [Clostridia bacterium]
AQIFADVRTFWSPEATKRVTGFELEGKAKEYGGIIHLLNSGAACLDACGECRDEDGNPTMKRWWEVTDEDIKKMTDATVWCEAGFDNFRGGGFSSHFTTRAEMPVTMIRLNLVKGLGPVLQIAEGWTVHLPDEVSDALMERTNPTWPCTWFVPRCDGRVGGPFENTYAVMNNWGANHGAISYGHIGADIITLCSMLRIPVCMHNVPEDKIFRPAVWNAFGSDKEGQDYRACAAFGPLYKKN